LKDIFLTTIHKAIHTAGGSTYQWNIHAQQVYAQLWFYLYSHD